MEPRAVPFSSALAEPRLARLLAVLAVLVVLVAPAVARADDAHAVELAKNRFNAGQYEEAHAQFARLLDPRLPPCDTGPSGACSLTDADLIERTRVLDAASLIALKRSALADAEIENVLRQNPSYAPSPALFPQEVVDRFTEMRGRLHEELEKVAERQAREAFKRRVTEQQGRDAQEKWIADLQTLAGQQQRIEVGSRWLAMLPLGVGQYQNGDTRLGAFFTTTEVLLGAASVASAAYAYGAGPPDPRFPCRRTPQDKPTFQECYTQVNDNIALAVLVNRISFGALVAVTLAGIVQGQTAFVPERVTTTTRPVPPRPKVTPTISFDPRSLGVGIVGSF